jgi:hypothetical protein
LINSDVPIRMSDEESREQAYIGGYEQLLIP